MSNQAIILAGLMLGHTGGYDSVKTVSTELAELSAESGKKMVASPNLGKQLIFVARHGRSPESVLSYIATALHASVVQNSLGFNLVRTDRDIKSFNEQRTKERSEWLRKRIDSVERYRLAHGVGASTTTTSELFAQIIHEGNTAELLSRGKAETPEPHYATELLPNEPLLLDIIKKIGFSRIATLGSERAGPSTLVLENAPTVWKASTIPSFNEELNTFYSNYDKVPQQAIPQQVVSLIPALGMTPFFEGWGTNRSRPEKLRLMVRAEPGLITFYLQGYDGEGKEVLFSYEHAGPTAVLRFPSTIAAPYFIRNDSHWTQASDIAEQAIKFRRITSREEVPEWFKHPDKIEPMNVFVADALRKLSDLAPNQCFVVGVSDSLWTDVATAIHNRQTNLDAVKALMIEWSLYEELKGSEGTVCRPRELLDSSSSTANRKALGEFARSCLTSQSVELRSVARFAFDAGADQTALINLWMTKLQSSPILVQNAGHAQYEFYRLLGAIPNNMWDALLQGQPASVSELGVGDKFEDLLEQDFEKPVGNGPVPDIYQH